MEKQEYLHPNDPQPLRFGWSVDPKRIALQPRNLRNDSVKCYRNALYAILFHTPVLLNYIDDKHDQDCECKLCQFRKLAKRFLAPDEDRLFDDTFDDDVDLFWREAILPSARWVFTAQNDPVEYMDRLFEFLQEKCGVYWIRNLIYPTAKALKACNSCSSLSVRPAPLSNLSLSMPWRDASDVELGERLADKYPLGKTGPLQCRICNYITIHSWSEPLEYVPPILPISLSPAAKVYRGNYYRASLKRLDQLMVFSSYENPVYRPHLIKYTFYRLYGVIMHINHGANLGHYICAVENPEGEWLLFNDLDQEEYDDDDDGGGDLFRGTTAQSKPTTLQEVEEMQKRDWRVYVLFYEKLFELPGEPAAEAATATATATATTDKQTVNRGEKRANDVSSDPRLTKRRATGRPAGN